MFSAGCKQDISPRHGRSLGVQLRGVQLLGIVGAHPKLGLVHLQAGSSRQHIWAAVGRVQQLQLVLRLGSSMCA